MSKLIIKQITFKISLTLKKILITGGAGFIGSNLSKELLKDNDYYITAVDNLDRYYPELFKMSNINQFLINNNFKFYRENILNFDKLKAIFERESPDIVIHLAAKVGIRESFKNPKEFEETNIRGTNNVLLLSSKLKVNKFIFASSSSVYGADKPIPFSEEQKITFQISPYASSKMSGELLCRKFHNLSRINIIILRLFSVYGPLGRPDMVPYRLVESIYKSKKFNKFGNGDSERDYTSIEDLIKGFISVIEKNFGFEIINLGTGTSTSLNDLIRTTEELIGKKAIINSLPAQKGDIQKVKADITKAKKILDFNPQYNLINGMKSFINWYRENRL